ncbi:uncharacterized protein EI97DRAFT_1552 [Westerdykella ornata]|uniref:Pentatricopeptide repeat protein-like protein n=1 Tax=Westerdykella ornata TaxID=318751 RepID=A0A6A6JW11_WESOR|nr:uncharacterized protein EI97DRAFT_1552 [Westerdykella ornata]KAF2280587.1 hypothetical protein EI97DRAFT_1552 [Westerdykella ornata]
MSVLRAVDGTSCSAAVSNSSRPLLSFLCPALRIENPRRGFHQSPVAWPPRPSPPSPDMFNNFFIHALVQAGTCQEHQRYFSTYREVLSNVGKHSSTPRRHGGHKGRRQPKSTFRGPFAKVKEFARNELKALVDYYGIELKTGPMPDNNVEDSGLLIWNIGDDHQPWPVKEDIHKTYIAELEQELAKKDDASHDVLYELYKKLPAPSVAYLKLATIRDLLHHLSVVERPDAVSMQRFLGILDDMKYAHIHITRCEWTAAIRFAGRFLGKVSGTELHSALHVWRDMEKRAGIRGGTVTMNVLFDLAVKAGKYTLAEAFLREMQARKLKLHRHFRVSLLYYYGVMQNGDAVRRAYQELVAAGDIVDTVVMNAVISALIRAGEPSAAEHVFERMKRLHASKVKPRPSPRNWRERRLNGLQLTYEGRNAAGIGDMEKRKELQEQASIAPDARTYGLIIRHHAATAGNVDRVLELLKEMELNEVPMDGTVFIVILYGFNTFGGLRYSSWTLDKLERVWKQYLNAVRDGVERTWLSPMSVVVALKAFKRCGDAERVLQAWEEARELWKPNPDELDRVLKELRRLVPNHPFFSVNV